MSGEAEAKMGEKQAKSEESKKAVGTVWERGQHQLQELPPESAPHAARRRQEGRRPRRLHFLKPELAEEFQNSLGCPGGTHC